MTPAGDIIIQKASPEDAKEILALQKLAYTSEAEIYNDFTIPPLHQSLGEIVDEFENQHFLKSCADGRIIGSVRAHAEDKTCHIGRLIVHPDCQNEGIGTRLLEEIENVFGNAPRFELFTGHRSEKNLYLYQKQGYKVFKNQRINEDLTIVFLEKYRNNA